MSGFAVYGVFTAIDRLALDDALAGWALPLFLATLAATLAWGGGIAPAARKRPSPQRRLSILLLGHGFGAAGACRACS